MISIIEWSERGMGSKQKIETVHDIRDFLG